MLWFFFKGKGNSEDTKSTVFVILCKCAFDTVDADWSLEGLCKIRRFNRVICGEELVVTNGWLYDGTSLAK